MRALGIDLGTVRVGVAVCDPAGVVATPLTTVPAGEDLADRLAALAANERAEHVVVGLPRALSGRDTDSTRAARTLAAALESLGLAVSLQDERLSSVQADRLLVQAGRRRTQRRAETDSMAAAIILQGWLDARPR